MKEGSLVAFTVLSQAAVGALWVWGALGFAAPGLDAGAGLGAGSGVGLAAGSSAGFYAGMDAAVLTVVVALMVLALAGSFLHLGSPARAWRALSNLRRSWLSREILSASLYLGAASLLAAMVWLDAGAPATRTIVTGLAAFLGALLLHSMVNVYRLRTVPAWNTSRTLASFAATALLLGSVVVAALAAWVPGAAPELGRSLYRWDALGGLALVAFELGAAPRRTAGLAPSVRRTAGGGDSRRYGPVRGLRLALLVCGVAILALLAAGWAEDTAGAIALVALVVLLASEALGRSLFYDSRDRLGV